MANPSSMDDLNLDNLFGGDDLFGGLDEIDLGGFDEISSLGGSARRRSQGEGGGGFGLGNAVGATDDLAGAGVGAPPPPAFDEMSFDLSTAAPSIDRQSLSPPPFPSMDQRLSPNQYLTASGGTKKSQRKRKAKKFLGDEDDSDDGSNISIGMGTKSAKATHKGKGKQSGSGKKAKVSSKKDNKGGATSAPAASSTSPIPESLGALPQIMPPPLPRPGQGGVNVAALPQYLQGSAIFESGQSGQTSSAALAAATAKEEPSVAPQPKKSKSKKKKPKQCTTKPDEGSPSDAQAAASNSASSAVDPSYCGLESNTIMFYPFMPLPAEVGMRRLQKAFPELEKIHVHLTRTADAVSPGEGAAAMNDTVETVTSGSEDMTNPLFRLFVDHLGALDPSQSSSKAAAAAAAAVTANTSGEAVGLPGPEEINQNIHKHLGEARKEISGIKNVQLRDEVMKVLLLVRRQSNFLGTSLSNMDRWCKEHLSESEYAEGFGDETPDADKHSKRGALGSGTIRSSGHILPTITSTTPVYVKIRVKCKGFKESTSQTARLSGGPLVAQLPISAEVAHESAYRGTTPPSKRRRKSSAGATTTASNISYEFLTIPERRRLLARAISTQAFELEARQKEVVSKRDAFRKDCSDKIAQIIKDDPVQVCHTTTLWQIMKHSPFILDVTEEDIREGLVEAWQPELGSREMHWGEIPAVRIFRSHPSKRRKREKKEGGTTMPPMKLFDRLQSLLVDVGSDDDEDHGAELGPDQDGNGIEAITSSGKVGGVNPNDKKDFTVENASLFASDPNRKSSLSSLYMGQGDALLDLSKFSLDQRAYVQLRALGLADAPLLPSLLPIVEEEIFVPTSKNVSVNGGAKRPTLTAAPGEDKLKLAMPLPETLPSKVADSNGHRGESNGAVAASAGIPAPSPIGREKRNNDNEASVCDDLDTVIRRMQDDLSGMHRSINMRAASLQACAEEQMFEQRRVKRREEVCSSLVAKHTQLMKKKKEAQSKKIPPKSSKEHEDWLPW